MPIRGLMYTRVYKFVYKEIQNNFDFPYNLAPLSAEFHRSQYKKIGVFKQNYVIPYPFFKQTLVYMFRKYTKDVSNESFFLKNFFTALPSHTMS